MKKTPGGGDQPPGHVIFPAMRRSIALIALLTLVAAGAPTAGRGDSSMACCHGTTAMACCLPAPGCAVKSCPPSRTEAALPGLPPAVLGDKPAAAAPEPTTETALLTEIHPRARSSSPPEQPPRL
jgi:hypothetical protein